jgi:uncharacterized protein (TIGR00251 family)
MMSFEEAIHASKDGAVIDFEVTPGARSAEVPSGYNVWRKRIEAKLRAPPEKGKANDELVEALSGLFNVPARGIEITSGATSSRKSVLIRGVNVADAAKIIGGRLDGRL